ncbi:hypothetical protein KDX38_12565 [Pseudomonas sp. CDFA 602]|uniref:hypothetical protein n=1 Tax=Pseudomonas californiensis TaxID=2829823 RepID=UPI001E50F24A|nr:hypothetical protein [Pseudomonas californiensis]MCD5994589.1 hypothetical protein [Pseudomonas californiensis]MCD6000049.1 hypothetical protein [Pseudomonas californiensis]
MCGPKEPVAGVFLLLVLAAGGWVAQEPFPHFGIEVSPEMLLNGQDTSKAATVSQTTPDYSVLYTAVEGR